MTIVRFRVLVNWEAPHPLLLKGDGAERPYTPFVYLFADKQLKTVKKKRFDRRNRVSFSKVLKRTRLCPTQRTVDESNYPTCRRNLFSHVAERVPRG